MPPSGITCKVAAATTRIIKSQARVRVRNFATVPPGNPVSRSHKVVVVGGGTGGLSVSHQLLRTGAFKQDDIAIIDPAEWHHYQPGWTLVSGGFKRKEDLRKPLASKVDPKLRLYNERVGDFVPEQNCVLLSNGDKINYESLVVAPGINIDMKSIKGLSEALADPASRVSTVYSYDTCDKTTEDIRLFQKGNAIFTQPSGVIKCAGAPQKVMWLAWDRWNQAKLFSGKDPASSAINITFATGLPSMFGVAKYNAKLEELRKERGVEGLFQHDLIAIEGNTAIFARPDGHEKVSRKFDLLHAVPKMGPYAFVKNSKLADQAGYVDVDSATLQHKTFSNVWSLGDASSLPTSRTAAAITAQAPVLVKNLIAASEGTQPSQEYDGYTSCPLTIGENKVLLAEFKYGGVPKETFGQLLGLDQGTPRRAFWHLKKDFFPWVYDNYMTQGKWAGPKGFVR